MRDGLPGEEEVVNRFIESLPDPEGARAFRRRLESEPSKLLEENPRLLSRLLTISAYSPFLSETILKHREYIPWLEREAERDLGHVKSTEQLSEQLARFLLGAMDTDRRTCLARFKRREFLRIYLRDVLAIAALSELTEELSNLADVLLADALTQSYQEMTRAHGAPLERDERGRVVTAEFAIIALGKLGCRELNYASDIDLFFLYSSPGETAGDGRRRESVITNKEFFAGVAERVVQMIGSNSGEGAVYRIDLRLRPYGRDGDLVWDLARAVDYYRTRAEGWERQTLIRARVSAGSDRVATRFLDDVRDVVFSTSTRVDSFEGVRRVKEKIDREVAGRGGGFNVKLGQGGIREIEFIAQALQLEYGGREPWVRSTQTLIVLARLSEKGYISEAERARLSSAYTLLRTIEHRLQMEHGAQTHTLPTSPQRLRLVARRCGYLKQPDPTEAFLVDLESHINEVRSIYGRVFGPRENSASNVQPGPTISLADLDDEMSRSISAPVQTITRLIETSSASSLRTFEGKKIDASVVEAAIKTAAATAIDPLRTIKNLGAWAESLSTYQTDQVPALSSGDWLLLIDRLSQALTSPYLASILTSRPHLARVLIHGSNQRDEDFERLFRNSVVASDRTEKPNALRRYWYECILGIGLRDMMDVCAVHSASENSREVGEQLAISNRSQTALAESALTVALEVTLEEIGAPSNLASVLPFAVLALGRLGHAGMDYGSDIDLIVVFDDSAKWPLDDVDSQAFAKYPSLQEFCARVTTELVNTLGAITREGMIYRVDLRLRPEGKSGPLARGLSSLLWYISNRASAWEHSAYLKVREVAGSRSLGAQTRKAVFEACFEAASQNASLKQDLFEMRMRLEREKASTGRPDIKWGIGGMTDAYFVTRYLQLKHSIYFAPELGTRALIGHLAERNALDQSDAHLMLRSYTFLRRLDHWIRLLVDRPTSKLPASTRALVDISKAMGLNDSAALESELADATREMREVFSRTFAEDQ